MRCVQKSLVLSSNFIGISLNWPPASSSRSSSTKKISFSLAFNAAHVSKLIGQRLVFKTLSAHPSSVLGVRLMWIISVCSLYVELSIRQASTEIMLLCAKSCIIMFGWCILLVNAVSVKRINSAGIKCLLMICMAAVATIIWLNLEINSCICLCLVSHPCFSHPSLSLPIQPLSCLALLCLASFSPFQPIIMPFILSSLTRAFISYYCFLASLQLISVKCKILGVKSDACRVPPGKIVKSCF